MLRCRASLYGYLQPNARPPQLVTTYHEEVPSPFSLQTANSAFFSFSKKNKKRFSPVSNDILLRFENKRVVPASPQRSGKAVSICHAAAKKKNDLPRPSDLSLKWQHKCACLPYINQRGPVDSTPTRTPSSSGQTTQRTQLFCPCLLNPSTAAQLLPALPSENNPKVRKRGLCGQFKTFC